MQQEGVGGGVEVGERQLVQKSSSRERIKIHILIKSHAWAAWLAGRQRGDVITTTVSFHIDFYLFIYFPAHSSCSVWYETEASLNPADWKFDSNRILGRFFLFFCVKNLRVESSSEFSWGFSVLNMQLLNFSSKNERSHWGNQCINRACKQPLWWWTVANSQFYNKQYYSPQRGFKMIWLEDAVSALSSPACTANLSPPLGHWGFS